MGRNFSGPAAQSAMSASGDLASLASGNVPKIDRAIYEFTIPRSIADATGVTAVGIVELTGYEEMTATKLAGNDAIRLGWELARLGLKTVNSKVLTDEDADVFWSRAQNAKIRTLVVTAFNQVNQPNQSEGRDFLGSCQIKVG